MANPAYAEYTPVYYKFNEAITKKTQKRAVEGERHIFACYQRPIKGMEDAWNQRPNPEIPIVPSSDDFGMAMRGELRQSKPILVPDQLRRDARYGDDLRHIESTDSKIGRIGMTIYEVGANLIDWKHVIMAVVELDPPYLDTFIGSQWDLVNEGDKSDVRWQRTQFVYQADARYDYLGSTTANDTEIDGIGKHLCRSLSITYLPTIKSRLTKYLVRQWVAKNPTYNLLWRNCRNLVLGSAEGIRKYQ